MVLIINWLVNVKNVVFYFHLKFSGCLFFFSFLRDKFQVLIYSFKT